MAGRLVASPNSPLPINDLAPEVIAELKSAGILRDKKLARPVQLLGTFMLETKSSADPWKALHDNSGDASLRPVWQRAILTSCLQSTRATQLLQVVSDDLLENNGERLRKMLTALATIEVVPNPLFLDEKLTPDIEPADRAKYAHHLAVSKSATWVRFLDWLMPLVPTLPRELDPDVLPVFSTWQTTFAGNKVRHCRQIGELAYKWLLEVSSEETIREALTGNYRPEHV